MPGDDDVEGDPASTVDGGGCTAGGTAAHRADGCGNHGALPGKSTAQHRKAAILALPEHRSALRRVDRSHLLPAAAPAPPGPELGAFQP